MDGWMETGRQAEKELGKEERKERARKKQKTNRVNVNICKIWGKAVLQCLALLLQLSCNSETVSKQKMKIQKKINFI